MKEEKVTKAIIAWLKINDWKIICFDFPQSGTGKVLHPDNLGNEKNLDSIIPDIVAVKNDIAVFFENKDRFYLNDYIKVHNLIQNNNYSCDINKLLSSFTIEKIFYGIGIPTCKHSYKSIQNQELVNFIIGVNDDETITQLYGEFIFK